MLQEQAIIAPFKQVRLWYQSMTVTGTLCRSGDQVSQAVKTGSVAGTVPGGICRVPRQAASHMRAPHDPGTESPQETFGGFCHMGGQPGSRGAYGEPEWRIQFLIGRGSAADKIGQQKGGDHGQGHAPFAESGSHIPVRCPPGKTSYIGKRVQGHAVLGRPLTDGMCMRKQVPGRGGQRTVGIMDRLSGPVAAASQEKIIL